MGNSAQVSSLESCDFKNLSPNSVRRESLKSNRAGQTVEGNVKIKDKKGPKASFLSSSNESTKEKNMVLFHLTNR